jgi:predicted acylesterase/phospholipase RssA
MSSSGESPGSSKRTIGFVLSGGGSRAAYQVGALRALCNYIEASGDPVGVVVGSSIGAVNGLILASCMKRGLRTAVEELTQLWSIRTFRNSFAGSPSMAFLRSIKMAMLKYSRKPGPEATQDAIFDPTPLMQCIDSVLEREGGLLPSARSSDLHSVAVMTTMEGKNRKPLLFLSSTQKLEGEMMKGASFDVHHAEGLTAKHAFASAALPTVLPPVTLDVDGAKVSLVDGGISQNIPVDPAVRLGAERVIIIDISGRHWWLDHYGEKHDKRPDWEVPAGSDTFCLRPPETLSVRCNRALGPILKASVGGSTASFIAALGPTWPVFSLVRKKLGEDLAYEALSYIALHPAYSQALMEVGYNDTVKLLHDKGQKLFSRETHE